MGELLTNYQILGYILGGALGLCLIISLMLGTQWLFRYAPVVKDAPLPTLPMAVAAPDWTPDDAQMLRHFLTAPTGQKLLQRGNALHAATAIAGAKELFHVEHSAGVTVGFGDCLRWLESLASDEMIAKHDQPKPEAQEEGEPEPVEIRRSF